MTCCTTIIGDQHGRSIAGEIIGSFMAGVVIATIIILMTGEFMARDTVLVCIN